MTPDGQNAHPLDNAAIREQRRNQRTLYNRWKRWSEKGVFARILLGLAAEDPENGTVMIDATYLKTHRTATSLQVKKGGVDA